MTTNQSDERPLTSRLERYRAMLDFILEQADEAIKRILAAEQAENADDAEPWVQDGDAWKDA